MSCASLALAAPGCARTPSVARPPLRIGLSATVEVFDPHLRNEFATFAVLSHVYDALTRLDDRVRIQPALAESWTSPDDRTWRLKLRHGVRFHDGRPLSARDVVFSLERVRRHPKSEFASYLVSVQEIHEIAPDLVEIVTERPNPMLLNRLAFVLVVPAGAPDEIHDPIGSGPYRLDTAPGGGRLPLAANPDYWDGAPREASVEFVTASGEAGVRKLEAGELDLLTDLDAANLQRVAQAPGCRVVSGRGPSVDILRLDLRTPLLRDRRVRQAISLALDRDALALTLAAGTAQPAGEVVGANVFGFDPGLRAPARDLAEARRLLQAAGVDPGRELLIEHREGRRAAPIAAQLAEAGFRVKAQGEEWDLLLKRVRSGAAALVYASLIADSGDAGDVLSSTFHSRDAARGFGDSNFMGYANPALDRRIEAAGVASDMIARRRLLQECLRLVSDDAIYVPLLERRELYGLRAGLRFEPRDDGRVLATHVTRANP